MLSWLPAIPRQGGLNLIMLIVITGWWSVTRGKPCWGHWWAILAGTTCWQANQCFESQTKMGTAWNDPWYISLWKLGTCWSVCSRGAKETILCDTPPSCFCMNIIGIIMHRCEEDWGQPQTCLKRLSWGLCHFSMKNDQKRPSLRIPPVDKVLLQEYFLLILPYLRISAASLVRISMGTHLATTLIGNTNLFPTPCQSEGSDNWAGKPRIADEICCCDVVSLWSDCGWIQTVNRDAASCTLK